MKRIVTGPFKVENFRYDGLFVHTLPGLANYTATFTEWTDDPGIALCECSDGKTRKIPSCSLIREEDYLLPGCKLKKSKTMTFGEPSHS